jgi:subtilisin family serine protease
LIVMAATARAAETVSVYVVLDEPRLPAAAFEAGRPGAAAAARLAAIAAQQDALLPMLVALEGREQARFRHLVNAVQIDLPADRLGEVAALPGVVRVDRAGVYSLRNATSVPFVGAPGAWQLGPGLGEGVSIGIVDSGIDYLHAAFGGPGRTSDYTGNDRTVVETGTFPTARVVGGRDFAGDSYNASSTTAANRTPRPDPDPLDCGGHGTHVAGTAAGSGALLSGATYNGPYVAGLDPAQFRVGPGVAPRARLYALKVFGCEGSTSLVTSALEWAADPDGDGSTADRLDVVNLSLGCDFSCGSPTELEIVERLVGLGTFVAAAAGNAGDTSFVHGDPGNAPAAAGVAAVNDDGVVALALRVSAPAAVAGDYLVVEGDLTRDLADTGAIAAQLAATVPADACAALTNPAALAGRIALIDRGTCFFADKILRAQGAGALAVVMVNNVDGDPIVMGGESAGIAIPGVMITRADGARLRSALAGGVAARLAPDQTMVRADLADQVAAFSSRGPLWRDGTLKPDLAAPGYRIASAAVGTGTGAALYNGTSMATPHVAGAAAVLRGLRPTLTPAQIKAALINTAAIARDATGTAYPASRAGAGRIRVDLAARTPVTAAAAATPAAVALSLGVIEVGGSFSAERLVRLTNHGAEAVTYDAATDAALAPAGFTLTPTAATVTVPPGGTVTLPVRLAVDAATFAAADDPSTPATQGAEPRHRPDEASGAIVLTSAGHPTLRVPYYGIVRAVSDLAPAAPLVCQPSAAQSLTLPLTGAGVHPAPPVTALQLAFYDPPGAALRPPLEILAVGVGSDFAVRPALADATAFFGIATHGVWPTPQPFLARFEVGIDTNRDGRDDFVLSNHNAGNLAAGDLSDPESANDVFVSVLRRTAGGATARAGTLNVVTPDAADTRPFFSHVVVLPVRLADLELSAAAPAFDVVVRTYDEDDQIDASPRFTFDPTATAIDASGGVNGSPLRVDPAAVPVRIDPARFAAGGAHGLLLLAPTNRQVAGARIVELVSGGGTDLAVTVLSAPASAAPGAELTYQARVDNLGTASAPSVRLTGGLPPGLEVRSLAAGQGSCTWTATDLACELGTLAAGGSTTVTLTARPARSGAVRLDLAVSSADACDPAPANNAATLATDVVDHQVRRRLRSL